MQEKGVVGTYLPITIRCFANDKRNAGHAVFDGRSVNPDRIMNTQLITHPLQKCDEQREGDSCKTCKRLTLTCLGWGPKRPDWMRVSTGDIVSPTYLLITFAG